MNATIRLSAGIACDSVSLASSAYELNICWITPFWALIVIHVNDDFNNNELTDFVTSVRSTSESVPPHRHQQNNLESHTVSSVLFPLG